MPCLMFGAYNRSCLLLQANALKALRKPSADGGRSDFASTKGAQGAQLSVALQVIKSPPDTLAIFDWICSYWGSRQRRWKFCRKSYSMCVPCFTPHFNILALPEVRMALEFTLRC